MAGKTITIPDFEFGGMYYAQILESLIQYKRRNLPELTDESEFEPAIQFMRAFALVGHLNNTLLDLVANESTLPTAQLADSVRNILRVIDYRMSPATPAVVDLLYKISKVFTSSYLIVPQGSQAATVRQGNNPAVIFESNQALTIDRTDMFSSVFVYHAENGSYSQVTYIANTRTLVSGISFPPTMKVNDSIYFGHKHIMWNKINFNNLTIVKKGSGYSGVWEYHDGDFLKSQPDSVVKVASQLRFDINGLLGIKVREGSNIRVTLNDNGNFEDISSKWDGTNNYVIVGLLGQSSPSLSTEDYSVGSDWVELKNVEDKTNMFLDLGVEAGSVEWDLPQTSSERWSKATVGFGSVVDTCYWVRFRVTAVYSPETPIIPYNIRLDQGKQWVLCEATQGQLAADDPLGSSTGLPDQEFKTSRDFFIVGTMKVSVDSEVWTEVDNFFNSTSADKHYVVDLGSNDRATVVFGSGLQGKIPAVGINNIVAEYRFGADTDGNVGFDTITVDKTGLTFVDEITNPRQASGWQEAEGSTETSLARAKIAGPASIHVREVAIGPDDTSWLVLNKYTNSAGAKPYARALPIEEGLGPKTIELVLVKKGFTLASASELGDVNEYFNGNPSTGKIKRIVANQKVTSFNYSQRLINIEAIVTVTGNVTAQEIENNLRQNIQPLAQAEDGVTWEWEFGDVVPTSRLIHEIFNTNRSKISKVVLKQPTGDISTGKRELPVAGVVSITVIQG